MFSKEDIEGGKTLAIVSYFTFIGLIVAMAMNIEKKNPFTAFHVRQMLGLVIMLIFSNVTEKYVNSWLGTFLWALTFGCWLYGLFGAATGKSNSTPVLGEKFQDWFKNLGR